MKRSDLTIVAAVGVLGVLAAFWFLVLSPKREEAGKLSDDVAALEAAVAEQEQLAAAAATAEKDYDENYQRLVVLGKAVPEDADTSSLLVELQGIADRTKVSFDSMTLSDDASSAASSQVAAPPPLTSPSDPSGEGGTAPAPESGETAPAPTSEGAPATPAATSAPAAPTEADAATLPIGATVGPAGLPVMPYSLSFAGGFFEIADFLAGLDGLVKTRKTFAGVQGRLMTIDGFSLEPQDDSGGGDPTLQAALAVTTYLTPSEEGAVAGATPTTPPATTPTPTSTTTPAPTP